MRWKRVLVAMASCLSIIACVFTGQISSARAFEYVQNGSFENGTSPWLVIGDGSLDAVDTGVISVPDGSRAARLMLDGPDLRLRQGAFANVPPGSYHAEADVRISSAATRVAIRASSITPSTNFQEAFAPSDPNAWQLVTLDFYVSELSDVELELAAYGAPGDVVYVDDLRFEGAGPVARSPAASETVESGATATAAATTATARATRTSVPTRTPVATRTPASSIATITGPELLNGGFEEIDATGMPAVWQKYGGTLADATSMVRNGAHAGMLESDTSSTKWVYQTITIEAGTARAFSAWVNYDDPAVTAAFLRVSWYASNDGSGTSIGTKDSTETLTSPAIGYRYLTTGAIAAPTDTRSAKLRIMLSPHSDAPAHIRIDDASFEPASLEDAQLAALTTRRSDPGERTETVSASTQSGGTRRKTQQRDTSAPDGQPSSAKVMINEVMYDPDGGGTDAEGEWVELFNAGTGSIDLKGWALTDNGGGDELAAHILEPLQYVVVAASDQLRTGSLSYTGPLIVVGGSVGNSLGNAGDRLVLKDSSGAVSDAISWGSDRTILDPAVPDVPAGHSIERRVPGADTDSAEDFVDNVRPSPGGPYQEASSTSDHGPGSAHTEALMAAHGDATSWIPWAAVGSSVVLLTLAAGWHAVPALRRRLHRPG